MFPASTQQKSLLGSFPVCLLGGLLWLQHTKPLEATGNAWAASCMDVWQPESGSHNGNITPPPYIHYGPASLCCYGVAGGVISLV